MLNIIQNTIGAIRRVGESVVRAGLKMWLPFTKAETLGDEIVQEPNFDSNLGYTEGIGWSISGGVATHSGSTGTLGVTGTYYNNVYYEVTFTIDVIDDGVCNIYDSGSATTYKSFNSAGTHTTTILKDSNSALALRSSSTNCVVSFLSIKVASQTTSDISGNDNNAILKTGKALQFSGNDSVQTSFPSSYTIKTIAFWIKPTHSSTDETIFYGGGGVYTTRQLYLNHLALESETQHIAMNTYVNGTLEGVTYNGTPATLTQDEWQRVVLTSSTGFSVVSDTFDIGSGLYGSDGRFIMSDLQIYDEAWTTDDIAYDYANPQKLVTDSEDTSITLDNLKAWWHLSEGDGTVAFDSAPLLGVDVVPNGDFSTDNISAISGVGTRSVQNNKLKIQESGLGYSQCIYQNLLDSNKIYKVTFDLTVGTGDYDIYDTINGRVGLDDGSGSYSFYISSPTGRLYIGSNGAGDIWYLDNITAKEVFNIDGETYDGSTLGASYVDAQERIPQLGMMNWSKGSNLLTYSEDFSEWSNVNSGTGSQVVLTENQLAPDGTLSATKMFFDKGTGSTITDFSILQKSFASQSNTASVYLRADTPQKIMIRNSTTFQLIDVSTDWVRINKTDSGGAFKIGLRSGYLSGVPNTSTIYVWGAQVESGTTASAYRRTNGTAVTDATLISSATDSQKDILGNAVRVKGSGFNLDGTGYAEVLDDNDFDILGCNSDDEGAFSFMGWSKFNYIVQAASSFNVIYSHGLSMTSVGSFAIASENNNKISAFVSGNYITSTTTHNVGDWVHFALTRDVNGSVKLYINKTLENTITQINSISNTESKKVGWDSTANDRFYHERIDDVKFYNRELSSDEVEQNYNATKSGHNN